MNKNQIQAHFDSFYEDFFCELAKYGKVEEMHVCDNVGDHLIGNVYARYQLEEDAQSAIDSLNSRWYAARPVYAELSPVTDFREACCRQHEQSECMRGGFCNFMHSKKPSPALKRELDLAQRKFLEITGKDKLQERTPSPPPKMRRY
jgi:splicing factor U2AF subunit